MRNWFYADDMVMFDEEPDTQWFFSNLDGAIFKVYQDEHINIIQYIKGESGYAELYRKYLEVSFEALKLKNLT